jgi:hypothetical protein
MLLQSAVGASLFSLFIIVDVQMMLRKISTDEYVVSLLVALALLAVVGAGSGSCWQWVVVVVGVYVCVCVCRVCVCVCVCVWIRGCCCESVIVVGISPGVLHMT